MRTHWIAKVAGLIWGTLGAIGAVIPFFPDKWGATFYGLRFLPKWSWSVWVIGLLIIVLVAVFESGHRQFKLQIVCPNIKLHGIKHPLIRQENGVWDFNYTEGAGLLAHTLLIRNEATKSGIKKAVITAQLVIKRNICTYPLSPLSWMKTKEIAVTMGPAECRELILAVKKSADEWDWVVDPLSPSMAVWIEHLDFQFEVQIIDADSGKILPISPRLCFSWEWPRGHAPGNPNVYPIPEHEYDRPID